MPVCITDRFDSEGQLNFDTAVDIELLYVLPAPTNELYLEFGSTLDQDGGDESFAISNWEVSILPECPPPVVEDVRIDCRESDLVDVQLKTTETEDVYIRILSIPQKGQLYHREQNGDFFGKDAITKAGTLLKTREHRLFYRAYATYEGDHEDTFSYQSEYEGGTSSNTATVTLRIRAIGTPSPAHPTPNNPTPSNHTPSVTVETPSGGSVFKVLVVVAFVLIAFLTIAVGVFGYFLYNRQNARKEMISMFLGDNNTYFPNQVGPQLSSDGSEGL